MSGNYEGVLRFTFGDNPALSEELTALVVAGTKTATCAAKDQAEANGWVMTPGQLSIARDAEGRDKVLMETVEVSFRRFNEVDAAFAFDEGEDDRTLESWRAGHRRYFERNGGWAEDMMLYCERFKVIEVLS
jgi:uncharacterized protein YhfF